MFDIISDVEGCRLNSEAHLISFIIAERSTVESRLVPLKKDAGLAGNISVDHTLL